jgi:osmotically-inducible protein OsmY
MRSVPGRERLCRALVAWSLLGSTLGACHRSVAPIEGRTETQRPERSGERLEREVRAKLFEDPQLSGGGSIVVIVDSGHVVLEGWVTSDNERALAEADAATVAGVAGVDDQLLVRRGGDRHGSSGAIEGR